MPPVLNHVLLGVALALSILTFVLVPFPQQAPPAGSSRPAEVGHELPVREPSLFRSWLPGIVAWLGVVAGLILLYNSPTAVQVARLALLYRFGLLAAAVPFLLVILGLWVLPSLLGNLFVVRGTWYLCLIGFVSALGAGSVVMIAEAVETNAHDRFGTTALALAAPSWLHRPEWWSGLGSLLLLSWPVPYTCWRASMTLAPDQIPSGAWWWPLVGLVAGLLIVAAIYLVQFWIPPLPALQVLGWLGPGYLRQQPAGPAVLAPGHGLAALNLFAVLLVYFLSYWFAGPVKSEEAGGTLPAIFYVLLLWVLLGSSLSGLAFLLDYIRFPVTLAVVALSLLLALVNRTDHVFPLTKAEPAEPKTLRELADQWLIPETAGMDGKPGRTLVLVTAAGGGIQAAAWTAEVLTGLEERYGLPFAQSLRVISSVSGGSVGTLFYLDARADPKKVRTNAAASGLSATARGLAYPDLLRVLMPPLVARDWDRGSELEGAWRDRLEKKEKTLSDLLADQGNRAELPFAIFNATIAETGQRLVMAPAIIDPARRRKPTEPRADPSLAREWLEMYHDFGGGQLPLSTAARLSATFPYVSPMARPLAPPGLLQKQQEDFDQIAYHFADGGYVDNEGMVSLIEAMQQLVEANHQKKGGVFDRIFVLRIEPFAREKMAEAAQLSRGWFYATFGPIDALQNVRSASQVERNDVASRLFREAARARGIQIEFARLTFEAGNNYVPPLSWMLTDGQKEEIKRTWQHLEASNSLKDVDKFFRRQAIPADAAHPPLEK